MATISHKRGRKPKSASGTVAQLIARGASPKQVAAAGGFSERTARRRLKAAHGAQRFTGPRRVPALATPSLVAPIPRPTLEAIEDAFWSADTDLERAAASEALFAHGHPDYAASRAKGHSIFDTLIEMPDGDALFLLRDAGDLAEILLAVTDDPRRGCVRLEGELWPSDEKMRAAAHERAVALAEAVLERVKEAKP